MLTEEEKRKLRAEEEYRREVQAEFARTKHKSVWQKFLDFFESKLGNWVLTAVLATLITTLVSDVQHRLNKDRIEREAAEASARRDAELVAKVLPQLKDSCQPTGLTAVAVLVELGAQNGINVALSAGIRRSINMVLTLPDPATGKPINDACRNAIVDVVERKDRDIRQTQSTALADVSPVKSPTDQRTLELPPAMTANMGLPGLTDRTPIHATTDSKTTLTGVPSRIYVQIQRDAGQDDLAARLSAKLRDEKFIVPDTEKLAASKMPNNPQVRYFSEEDREIATRVAETAKKAVPSLPFEAVRVSGLPAPSGTLEIWFGRQR